MALSRAKAESVLYTDDRSKKMQVGLQERAAGMAARALKEHRADMHAEKQKAREKDKGLLFLI